MTFLHVALNLFKIDTNKLRFVNFDPKNARGGLATDKSPIIANMASSAVTKGMMVPPWVL